MNIKLDTNKSWQKLKAHTDTAVSPSFRHASTKRLAEVNSNKWSAESMVVWINVSYLGNRSLWNGTQTKQGMREKRKRRNDRYNEHKIFFWKGKIICFLSCAGCLIKPLCFFHHLWSKTVFVSVLSATACPTVPSPPSAGAALAYLCILWDEL